MVPKYLSYRTLITESASSWVLSLVLRRLPLSFSQNFPYKSQSEDSISSSYHFARGVNELHVLMTERPIKYSLRVGEKTLLFVWTFVTLKGVEFWLVSWWKG